MGCVNGVGSSLYIHPRSLLQPLQLLSLAQGPNVEQSSLGGSCPILSTQQPSGFSQVP